MKMSELCAAVREWRDARRVFFTAAASPGLDAWTRLADAEHKLMRLAERLESETND